ncbi:uncharacterized protein LOC112092617 [Morus notabilis]|uniref:uncharacterized protein LOC112092617 n=1 Tax=Morus notabilis TaxID=981085 RepID=UPI000CED6169|nr:uncharacterized protein LOC112092617 [Morus notabilis]
MLKSIYKKQPKTFADLVIRAQKFINAEEYMRNRRGQSQTDQSKNDGKRKVEEGSKGGEGKKQKSEAQQDMNKSKTALTQKFQAYAPPDTTRAYTPLNTTVAQILMQIQHQNLLTPPAPMKGDPNKRDKSKYCYFHKDHGHETSSYFQLKGQIEALIQQGQLQEFVDRVIAERRIALPTTMGKQAGVAQGMNTTDGNNFALNEVRTIFRGPETGDSMRARNLYAREAKGLDCVQFVNMTEHAAKFAKMENIAITFTEEEARKLLHPHNDAIVVSLQVANSLVHRILIDNGSLADILFKDALTKINLGGAKLTPVNTPLQGFTGACIHTEGMITLPVIMGEGNTKVTRMVNFLVVDQPSAYNVIIG